MGDSTLAANVQDSVIKGSEFKLQLLYYVHFPTKTFGKGMNLMTSQLRIKYYHNCFY